MNQTLNLRHRKCLNSVLCSLLFGILSVLVVVPPLEAAIIPTGNVEPVGTWTSSTIGYVGKTSDGSLLVDAGSVLQSYYAYIAYNSGVSGTATVTGAGSKWTNSSGPLRRTIRHRHAYASRRADRSAIPTAISAMIPVPPARPRSPAPARSGPIAVTFTSEITAAGRFASRRAGRSAIPTAISAMIPVPPARPRSPAPARSGPIAVIFTSDYDGTGTLTVADGGEVTAANAVCFTGESLGKWHDYRNQRRRLGCRSPLRRRSPSAGNRRLRLRRHVDRKRSRRRSRCRLQGERKFDHGRGSGDHQFLRLSRL